METRSFMRIFVIAAASACAAQAQAGISPGQEPLSRYILRMSEADQLAQLNTRLNEGLRDTDGVDMLVLNRSSLALPVIERKIEEVLRSPDPRECFTDKTVDTERFLAVAASMIADASDEQALKEISKLIAIDEKRFGRLVRNTMLSAQNRRNPFVVAYRGLDLGDPAVDKRILAWVEEQYGNKTEFWLGELNHWWAEALVERYGRVPLEIQWVDDPIASRIDRQLADSLHDEIFRLAAEARDKQAKK
jgi:hypothetical protein